MEEKKTTPAKEAEVKEKPIDDFTEEVAEVLESAGTVSDEKISTQKYEVTFIVPEDQNSDVAEAVLKANGAKITSVDEIGVKKLAYPIKKLETGKYFTVYFVIEPTNLIKIDKALQAKKEIIRHLIVKEIRKPIRKPRTGPPVAEAMGGKPPVGEQKIEEKKTETTKETPKVVSEEKVEKIVEEKSVEKKTDKIAGKPVEKRTAPTSEAVGVPTSSKINKNVGKKISQSELSKKLEELVED